MKHPLKAQLVFAVSTIYWIQGILGVLSTLAIAIPAIATSGNIPADQKAAAFTGLAVIVGLSLFFAAVFCALGFYIRKKNKVAVIAGVIVAPLMAVFTFIGAQGVSLPFFLNVAAFILIIVAWKEFDFGKKSQTPQ